MEGFLPYLPKSGEPQASGTKAGRVQSESAGRKKKRPAVERDVEIMPICVSAEITAQLLAAGSMAEAADGFFLDLTHAFAREIEFLADLLQREGMLPV